MKLFKYLFLSLFLLFISCAIFNPIRKSPFTSYSNNIKHAPFDAIIVPGVPFSGNHWNPIMRYRILWAKFLYERGHTKNIIFSGGAVHTPYIESKIMALYAEALGIPSTHIFMEQRAEHSTENIYYSFHLAQAKGFKNIALASDPYQTNNLNSYSKKYKLNLKFLPVLFDTIFVIDEFEPLIDYDLAKVDSSQFIPLKEREGFIKRLKGTLGKNIKYTEEDRRRMMNKK